MVAADISIPLPCYCIATSYGPAMVVSSPAPYTMLRVMMAKGFDGDAALWSGGGVVRVRAMPEGCVVVVVVVVGVARGEGAVGRMLNNCQSRQARRLPQGA